MGSSLSSGSTGSSRIPVAGVDFRRRCDLALEAIEGINAGLGLPGSKEQPSSPGARMYLASFSRSSRQLS